MHVPIHVFDDKSETKNLPELIAKQREFGGRLIAYPQGWAILFFTFAQRRIVWVPLGGNRCFAGRKQALFTLLFGIWAITFFIYVPMTLIMIFSGGIDVTEYYSTSPIDPHRFIYPKAGTAAADKKRVGRVLVTALFLVVSLLWLVIYVHYFRNE